MRRMGFDTNRTPAGLRGALLFFALLGFLGLRAHAQIVHVHNWQAVDNLSAPSVYVDNSTPTPGQLVSIGTYSGGVDSDQCTNNGTGNGDECTFYYNTAYNQIRVTGWSDNGAGGQFGYLDGMGQFTAADNPAQITNYSCPIAAGPVTITVTVDDIPTAVDALGNTVDTYDDAPASGSTVVNISGSSTTGEPHVHTWNPVSDIPAPDVYADTGQANSGDVVPVGVSFEADQDQCVNAGCSFYNGVAFNSLRVIGWTDQGAGGQFGYTDAGGQFVPASDPSQVTCYRCPAVMNEDRDVELDAVVDDIPVAVDPQTGETIQTYDDDPQTGSTTLTVTGTHTHRWQALDNLVAPTLQIASRAAQPGAVVAITTDTSGMTDTDQCINDRCPFPSGIATNQVRITTWSDGGAGGQFGFTDSNGQFAATDDPSLVTAYRCAASPGTVTITATVDDVPIATDPNTGELIATYDDRPATSSAVITILDPGGHTHSWENIDNLPTPQLQVGSGSASAGTVLPLSLQVAQDEDHCTNDGCPFPGGVAQNAVLPTGWSDSGAGGQFGYVDGTGQFIAAADPSQVTSYRCAASPGAVTLSVTVDDVPQATDPYSGVMVPTYDDQPSTASCQVTIFDASSHVHQWTAGDPVPTPRIALETSNPVPGQIVELTLFGGHESDQCMASGCPFPDGRADNDVQVSAWGDGGAGGDFGFLDGTGQFVVTTDPTQVTHYRCPATTGDVTLSATMDDLPQAIDPSGQLVSTFDDPPVTGSATLSVTPEDAHVHDWQAFDNLPAPAISTDTSSVQPGDIVHISVAITQDQDYCLDLDGLQCPFPQQTASNSVVVTGWSDGGAGGEFGYIDAAGQFEPTADPTLVTAYRVGTGGGFTLSGAARNAGAVAHAASSIQLSVTVSDVPQAQVPGTGQIVPTYHDASVTASASVQTSGVTPHQHLWNTSTLAPEAIYAPAPTVYNTTPTTGQVISVWTTCDDHDYCIQNASGMDYCSFDSNIAHPGAKVTAWSDAGAGGRFGYLSSNGAFVATTDPALITSYRCPTSPKGVDLSVTVDDNLQATNRFGNTENTRKEGPVNSAATHITVGGSTHVHTWAQSQNIPVPGLTINPSTANGGALIALTTDFRGGDPEYCTATTGCPLGGSPIYDPEQVVAWSDGGAGGQFGYTQNGYFYGTNDPTKVTTYACPTGYTSQKSISLTVTVDDIPQAVGTTTTYNDKPVTSAPATLVVNPVHNHQWNKSTDPAIPAPTVGVSNTTPKAGDIIALTSQISSDTDVCTGSGTCSFPNRQATNQVVKKSWSDSGAGGQFGYLTSSGFQPSSDPKQITSYRCPTGFTNTLSVFLSLTVDDVPQAKDGLGAVVPTTDDDPVTGAVQIQVSGVHQHDFDPATNTADCTVELRDLNSNPVSAATPCQLLQVYHGNVTADQDICKNPGCSFPGNVATETTDPATQLVSYQDDNEGMFGALDEQGKFYPLPTTAIDKITHYQCGGTPGNSHVWLEVQDTAKAFDPGAQQIIDTKVDGPHDGTKYALTVLGTPQRQCTPVTVRSTDWACPVGGPSDAAEVQSEVGPHSGELSFGVPVSSWTCQGMPLDLSLYYSSRSLADPSLDAPSSNPYVEPTPDFAHLSTRNSKWTHSWAQFVEVITNPEGDTQAVWHTGGGSVSFDLTSPGGPNAPMVWTAHDSYNSLTSSGIATTQLALPPGYGGSSEALMVPYGQFEATDGSGTKYEFTKVFWQKGKWTAIPYFLLSSMTDRFGRSVMLTWQPYSAAGAGADPTTMQLTDLVDSSGRHVSFSYGGGVTLQSITDVFGRRHQFTYGTYISEWNRPELKLIGATLQGPGSPDRVQYKWSFDYGGPFNDLLLEKTEPTGKDVHYTYEPPTGASGTRPLADWSGRMASCYYDDSTEGSRRKQITRSGDTITYPEGNSFQYLYDGNVFVGLRDASTGRTIHYESDSLNNLTRVWTDDEDHDHPLVQVDYQYGSDHRTIVSKTVRNPLSSTLGDRAEITYDQYNQPQTVKVGFRTTGGTGYNQQIQITPDTLGRPTQIVRSAPGSTGAYNSETASFLGGFYFDQPFTSTDPLGRTSQSVYDRVTGQTIQATGPANSLPGATDPAGSTETIAYSEELPALITDPVGGQMQISYTAENAGSSFLKVTTKRVADGATQIVVLDPAGRTVRSTDTRNVRSAASYNGDGLPLSMTEALGYTEQRTTTWAYNRNGDLTSLTRPNGETTTWEYRGYDYQGNPTAVAYEVGPTHVHYPDGEDEYYVYNSSGDLDGRMRKEALPSGLVFCSATTYQYDTLHRPHGVFYPQSPIDPLLPAISVSQEYDEFGRVVQTADANGTTQYRYDGMDRLMSVTPGDGRKVLTNTYFQDAALHRWRVQTTLSGVRGYWETQEDSKGRLAGVVSPSGDQFNLTYNAAGMPLTRSGGNGTSTSYSYDGAERLQTITHRLANSQVLDSFTYAYGPEDRIASETDAGSRVHGFTYDALGRLVGETHPADLGTGNTYVYDANDNRVKVTRNGVSEYYGYDAGDRLRWINSGGQSTPTPTQPAPFSVYTYDSYGRVATRTRRTASSTQSLNFVWDEADRLRRVEKNGTPVFSATYTGDGERLAKHDEQGSHLYSFGLHDTNGSAGDTVYTPGLSEKTGSTTRYYHQDQLGSTRYLTTNGNQAVAGLRYDAYGNRSATAGSGKDPSDFQWAGTAGYVREPHGGSDLGLDYCYQRYYDEAAGRWISKDPIGYTGGLNLYGYCNNDPTNFSDPTGEDAEFRWQWAVQDLTGVNVERIWREWFPHPSQSAMSAATSPSFPHSFNQAWVNFKTNIKDLRDGWRDAHKGDTQWQRSHHDLLQGIIAQAGVIRPGAHKFNWDHILDGHSECGATARDRIAGGGRNSDSIFWGMSRGEIKRCVERAWATRRPIAYNRDYLDNVLKIKFEGVDPVTGKTIHFWYDVAGKIVETAFPPSPR